MSWLSRTLPRAGGVVAPSLATLAGCTSLLGEFSLTTEGSTTSSMSTTTNGAGGATASSSQSAGGMATTATTGAGGMTTTGAGGMTTTGAGGVTTTGAGGAGGEGGAGGACTVGERACLGNIPRVCEQNGQWKNEAPCVDLSPVCDLGECVGQSCAGLPPTCGPGGNESCCASTVVVGGAYNRSNDASYPASVTKFRLDRFEITVGRFRRFVETYPLSKPMKGAGLHPLIGATGWQEDWDQSLPLDRAALQAAVSCAPMFPTWTNAAAGNENAPMNCITWFEAFAFCAWDGGRLPTEAEWNSAAAGGNEQRSYAWGADVPDNAHAVYNCTGDGSASSSCGATDILDVGSRSPLGDARWGQSDLSGSLWEWALDWYKIPYSNPCVDCAIVTQNALTFRVLRGGSWSSAPDFLATAFRTSDLPTIRKDQFGARCARSP